MNPDNFIYGRLSSGIGALVILPLTACFVFVPTYGVLSLWPHAAGAFVLLLTVCLAGYAGACWLAVRRGWLTTAVILTMVCGFVQLGFVRAHIGESTSESTAYRLRFGMAEFESGIDVYCNDVHLGTTPFLLTEEDFRERVEPWDAPPDQPRVIYHEDSGPDRFSRWTWVASNAFQEARDSSHSHISDQVELFDQVRREPYWWRFERDGCSGLRSQGTISNGGGGGNGVMTYDVSLLNAQYPAEQRLFERMLESARHAGYRPDDDWIRYFIRYRNFLEQRFYEYVEVDPNVAGLMNHITETHYGFSDGLNDETSRDLLARLLVEARETHQFVHPSLSSAALLKVAAAAPTVIADAYGREVESAAGAGGRRSGFGSYTVWSGGDEWVCRSLLLTAIMESQPAEAFDHLVWQFLSNSGRQDSERSLAAIARYDRPEAAQIVEKWMRTTFGRVTDVHGTFDFDQRRSLDILANITRPELQSEILQRVACQFPMTHGMSVHQVRDFYDRRVDNSAGDPDRLADSINQCVGLTARDKAKLLWRIHSPRAGQALLFLGRNLQLHELTSILNSEAAKNPNSFAASFIADAARRLAEQRPNSYQWADKMLLQMDNDEAREHLTWCATQYTNQRWRWMFEGVKERLPHLDGLVPVIERFETAKRKQESCRLLRLIGTDAALTLLEEWASGSDRALAAAVRRVQQLDPVVEVEATDGSAEQAINEAFVTEARALISGELQPDDLLDAPTPLIWTGVAYEPPGGDTAGDTVSDDAADGPTSVATPAVTAEQSSAIEPEPVVRPTLEETIDALKARNETAAAEYLSRVKISADRFRESKGWRYIFGRLVLKGQGAPRRCDSHLQIHASGWFVGSVGDSRQAGFHLFGYRPVTVTHEGGEGTIYNVGDVVMEPFRFEQQGTVRAECVFEGLVDRDEVRIDVRLVSPKSRSASGGSGPTVRWEERERVSLDNQDRIQLTGLSPMKHRITVKAPKHQPFSREFEVEPGGTTDVGLLRIPVSPQFEVEYAASETLDFTDAARHRETLFVGDRFHTNPAGKDRGRGPLTMQAREGVYRMRCGYYGCVQTDLGKGALNEFLKPVRPDVEKVRDHEADLESGHVYLISHSTTGWNHWTLIRVTMTSPFAPDASISEPAAD